MISYRHTSLDRVGSGPKKLTRVQLCRACLIPSSGVIVITRVCWLVGWFVRLFVQVFMSLVVISRIHVRFSGNLARMFSIPTKFHYWYLRGQDQSSRSNRRIEIKSQSTSSFSFRFYRCFTTSVQWRSRTRCVRTPVREIMYFLSVRPSMNWLHGMYIWFFGGWEYPGTATSFWLPLLTQERVKLLTSNFVRMFTVPIGSKAHEKFWEKIAVGVVRSPENFQGTHILGALRCHLWDSTAFLL